MKAKAMKAMEALPGVDPDIEAIAAAIEHYKPGDDAKKAWNRCHSKIWHMVVKSFEVHMGYDDARDRATRECALAKPKWKLLHGV